MEKLLAEVLGRSNSFIQDEINAHHTRLSELIGGARMMIIGAAGSIGSAFTTELLRYQPKGLHLVDISENNLVEVVRNIRSSGTPTTSDFRTYAIDFTQPEFEALLSRERFDYVMNFSALKHVRSERDPFTLMRMLRTNVLANEDLANQLSSDGETHLFSVSSDKAVRPGNLMGASKAFMERVLLSHAHRVSFTSARFANVAFSDGSLLHSFRLRVEKRQPLTAPTDVKRYFISQQEAGQLCLLGCFLGHNKEIFYPKFQPENDLMTFSEIAKQFLHSAGLTPMECESESEALEAAKKLDPRSTSWPCYFSSSDTAGEKPFEEFVDHRETVDCERFENVGVVTSPLYTGRVSLENAMDVIRQALAAGTWETKALAEAVEIAVPELNHVKSSKNLDQKM